MVLHKISDYNSKTIADGTTEANRSQIVHIGGHKNVTLLIRNNSYADMTALVKGFHSTTNRGASIPTAEDGSTEMAEDIIHNSGSAKTIAAKDAELAITNPAGGGAVHYTHIKAIFDIQDQESIDASGNTITFADADPDTITRASGDWTTHFKTGQTIVVSGSGSNDGTYTIASLTSTVITLDAGDELAAESNTTDTILFTANVTDYDFEVWGVVEP